MVSLINPAEKYPSQKLIPVLVKAIQEQQEQIERQEKEIRELKAASK